MRTSSLILGLFLPLFACFISIAEAKSDKDNFSVESHWLAKEKKDIAEQYDKAIYKIEKSQLDENLKNMLKQQADENKNLVMKQAEEIDTLMKQNQKAREAYRAEFMKDKSNRKAVKEVDDIL